MMVLARRTMEFGLLCLGVLLVILGALMARHWEQQIEQKYYQEMAISPNSTGVDEWLSTTVPIISKIYFWNWTNPEDITNASIRPNFVEMGPYVFREKHQKVNILWNDNATVTYKIVKYWHFDENLSKGSLDDNVTSINTFAVTASTKAKDLSLISRRLLSMALIANRQNIYWTKTVGELLFGGFDIAILRYGSLFSSSIPDKFGYFYGKNGTISNDWYTMDTGKDNIFSLGETKFWNFQNVTSVFTGTCKEVKGSSGEFWPPKLTNQSVLQLFTSDMCRRISFYYKAASSYKSIVTYMFEGTKTTVDNGTLSESNLCYCEDNKCVPSGVFDLTSCRDGAPILMSFPHLYLADDYWREQTTGMAPNTHRHKYFVEVEPISGVQVNVAARLQLNVRLTPTYGISMFSNVPNVLIPVFWIETLASLTESHLSGVRLFLLVLYIGPIVSAATIVLGISIILFIVIRHYLPLCSRQSQPQAEFKLNNFVEAEVPMIAKNTRL